MATYATAEGTARYAARFPQLESQSFFRTAQGLRMSSVGIGSYLGDEKAAYAECVKAALRGGVNFLDTSLNYRHQLSERNFGAGIGELLRAGEIARDEFAVCTKAGYLVPNAVPTGVIRPADVVGGMHCMTPAFLEDQLERSRVNLGLETIDVFYLHNPETQLEYVNEETFYGRVRAAFEKCEEMAVQGRIRYYGAATWNGFRARANERGLSLARMEGLAREAGGEGHRFRFIQLPVNMAMVEGFTIQRENIDGASLSTLQAAARLGITAIASASLLQARLSRNLPEQVAEQFPGLSTDAQRAIQFARSVPGVSTALVGMSSAAHVLENLRVGEVAPSALESWFSQSR
jgi:aryl-alcohol dehydrogenase-like predicted oxidoreductase